jgi:hypothetical protein
MSLLQDRAQDRTESALSSGHSVELDETSRAWIDRMYHGSDPGAADEARGQVEEILNSEGFIDANRNWFSELLEAYFEWRDKGQTQETTTTSSGGSSTWSPDDLIVALIIAVVVVLIVVLISRHFRGRRHDHEHRGTIAERVASRVEALRARAREAEASGDWIEALRLDFFALVIGLGERGDLDYRDAWTNRELLERGMPSRKVELSLRPVVKRLDAHSFGHLPSGPEEVVEFREFCDRLLEGRA